MGHAFYAGRAFPPFRRSALRRPALLRALFTAATLLAATAIFARPAGSPGDNFAKEITVWAITSSKVYHCPGSRWYQTGTGKRMGECKAIREGYKPAFGRGCGSTCE